MNYQHFIIIRWSIIYKAIFRKNCEGIFDATRLNNRIKFFKHITFYSLEKMEFMESTKILILIDKQLPEKYVNQLSDLIKQSKKKERYILHTWNDGDDLGSIEWMKPYINTNCKVLITTRLDDDDALHPSFCNKLKWHYEHQNCINTAITFPFGTYLLIDNINKKLKYRDKRYTKIGCGLTLIVDINIGKNVFDSDHEFIDDKKYVKKLIRNNTKHMYIVANHYFSDSLRVQANVKYRTIKGSFKNTYNYIDLGGLENCLL